MCVCVCVCVCVCYHNTWQVFHKNNNFMAVPVVIVAGNGHGDTSSSPVISHRTTAIEKDIKPVILPPAMGK